MRPARIIRLLPLIFALSACGLSDSSATPQRIILFIGDGMGPEQVRAGSYFIGRPPVFADFPVSASVETGSADSEITDSAAAATAIATGRKVSNGVLSLAIPGDGSPLETLLEQAAARDMRTGLATTTFATHATPAAFGAHRSSRTDYEGIAEDYLNKSRPNLIFGGGSHGLDTGEAEAAGYLVAGTRDQLFGVPASGSPRVAGLFGTGNLAYEYDGGPREDGHPDLEEMTSQALRLIGDAPDGFFLMVEGGLIDQAAHSNDAGRMVAEFAALDRAVRAALEWAAGRSGVLIVVTADHETGGIEEVLDRGIGEVPEIRWTTTGHTSRKVDLYAWGADATRFHAIQDNTEIRDAIFF